MIEVIPFRGLLYNLDITGPLDKLIAPPYDVISSGQQQALYEKHPNNVVRLILGKEFDSDTDADNRYTRSAQVFLDWINQEILKKDD